MSLQYSLQFALFQHRDLTKSILYTNSMASKAKTGLLVQDGRAEGHAFISSSKSTKTAISCWTTVNRRTLEPTKKKDTPRPKTKQQPQWDGRRGKITINSNPIPTYGWVTHRLEKSNTKEVLELLWRFWTPSQASQSGDPAKGLEIPRKSDLAGQQHLITGFPHDCGKQRLQFQRAETKFCMHQDPEEKSSDPTGLPAGVGGPPMEHGLAGAHHRDGGSGRSPQA